MENEFSIDRFLAISDVKRVFLTVFLVNLFWILLRIFGGNVFIQIINYQKRLALQSEIILRLHTQPEI